MTDGPINEDPQQRRNRLRDIVDAAIEASAFSIELPTAAAEASVDLIVNKIAPLAKPGSEQVAEIVKVSLEAAGEGARAAGEASGEIAKAIVEGISDLS